jgi:phosphopantothenoylcysteine decarboxylase / phosphopantothenate---cysteine ligase
MRRLCSPGPRSLATSQSLAIGRLAGPPASGMISRVMRFLITAGPSHEPIDAVRFIGNRSSGRMGVAAAEAAASRGHQVTLLLGPTAITPADPAVRLERFGSAAELESLLRIHWPQADCLLMAAAVADFRPVSSHGDRKIERGGRLTLELEAVPDLLAMTAATTQPSQLRVGFALEEPDRLEERARAKLTRKSLDAIVANPLDTMDALGIAAQLFCRDGRVRRPPEWPVPIAKERFAVWLIAEIEALAVDRNGNARDQQ